MRHKPKYNTLRLVHVNEYGDESVFYANVLNDSRTLSVILGLNVRGTGTRYITDTDIDFKVDDKVIVGEATVLITEIPEIKYATGDNNMRRGAGQRDRVIVTT